MSIRLRGGALVLPADPAFETFHLKRGLAIDASLAGCRWRGERMDRYREGWLLTPTVPRWPTKGNHAVRCDSTGVDVEQSP